MLDNNKGVECQEAHELMRVVREQKDTGEAIEAFGKIYNKYKRDASRHPFMYSFSRLSIYPASSLSRRIIKQMPKLCKRTTIPL